MSEFACPVVRIEEVSPIEGADKIESVRIGGYKSIVAKGSYNVGELAVYIPCSSLVPGHVLEYLGLVGKLSGKQKNRVKEIKLKGVLSEGLVCPLEYPQTFVDKEFIGEFIPGQSIQEGEDVAEILGITKYVPQVPVTMMGKVKPYPFTMNYDIENIKKYNRILDDGEEVVFSEKVHGTLIQVGIINLEDGSTFKFVTSKGLGKAGLIIQDVEENKDNLYIKTAKAYGLLDKLDIINDGKDIYLFGEIYGVQDLKYGESSAEPKFRAFDIYEGKKGRGNYLDYYDFSLVCSSVDIETVNYLYAGPFSNEVLEQFTNGKETMSGKELHIREGLVVRPVREREARGLGRVILKSVSEAYLTRKGDTTEYE